MTATHALLIGIIASVVGSTVYALVALCFASTRFRKQITLAFARVTGTGVEYVYSNEQEAAGDIVRFARRSEDVAILSMRGFRIIVQDRPLHFLVDPGCTARRLRLLLVDPGSKACRIRAEEYTQIDPSYSVDHYLADVRYSIETLTDQASRSGKLELRLHQESVAFRLLILDEYLFLSFFLPDSSGHQSQVFRVSRHSALYRAFVQYFAREWEKARKP